MKMKDVPSLLVFLFASTQALHTHHITGHNGLKNRRGSTGARRSGLAPSPSSLCASKGVDATDNTSAAATPRERRSFLRRAALSVVAFPAGRAGAADVGADPPRITHRVAVDVRCSRADGSFYVRDATPSDAAGDEPYYATLVLGLFGEQAPNHVRQFLGYADVREDLDNPRPSYSRRCVPAGVHRKVDR